MFLGKMLLRITLINFLVSALLAADNSITITKPISDLPHQSGTIQRVLWQISDKIRGDLQIVILRNQRYQVHLEDQSITFPVGALFIKQMRERQKDAIIAINGGYFDQKFNTLGLLQVAGVTLQPVSDKKPLSGIVAINQQGVLTLGLRDVDLTQQQYAIQAGPYIIDPGGVLGVQPTAARAPRTIIAINAQRDLVLIIAKAFTLHEVANFMLSQTELLGGSPIERALNLDGGPSTGMSCSLPGWDLNERGPIRNALVFTAPSQP